MATRDELIERVVAVMLTHYIEEDRTPREWDYLLAKDVLDAILPQVTTVEELEALPVGTKLLSAHGDALVLRRWERKFPCLDTDGALWSREAVAELLPLTVTWRPS